MNSIKFRIAAKTDVGLVRENNEDNFQASSDLSTEPMRWVNNEICSLGDKGALLVVADGMGGMNAGEVASELSIRTVRNAFSPENLTAEVMKDRFSIEKFMNSVIIEADKRIKAEAKSHPESRGMGTTIVIGWILNGKLYVSWCGDSRAYVYNPKVGLHQLSKDHSYVQELVDKGAIKKEDAFDYPESNIITRCLCDSSTSAKPESLSQPYNICDNDIIILCTDGLSGMIRDNEIETIMRSNEHNMDMCSDALIQAACDADGADNITICLCQILQGAGDCNPDAYKVYDQRLAGPIQGAYIPPKNAETDDDEHQNIFKKYIWCILVICLLLAITLGITYKTYSSHNENDTTTEDSISTSMKTSPTQTLVATDSRHFVIERIEGEPQIGDKAYPDGTYPIDSKKIITIKDSIIIAIETKDDTKGKRTNEKVDSSVESKTLDRDSVISLPSGIINEIKNGEKTHEDSFEDAADSISIIGEDILTPISHNN